MKYTNGEKTGLNKYETEDNNEKFGSLEWGLERLEVEQVVTVRLYMDNHTLISMYALFGA